MDLVGALLGWLTAEAGGRAVRGARRLVLGDPQHRALQVVMDNAVSSAVAKTGLVGEQAEHLCAVLREHGIRDGQSVQRAVDLRAALGSWIAGLEGPDTEYLSAVGVVPAALVELLATAITDGIQADARAGGALAGLAEWSWRDGTTARLELMQRRIEAWGPSSVVALAGLPAASSVFTGREPELAWLADWLNPCVRGAGPMVVAGLPGVGKSELALQATHRAVHAGWFSPGGVLFVELQGGNARETSPEQALAALLNALGVEGAKIPPTQGEREVLYRSVLSERGQRGERILVLLDNALSAEQVRPLLPGTPEHKVLITSQRTLVDLDGARLLKLDVLPVEESVALLHNVMRAAQARDTRITDDQWGAAELARLCGCLPLALRIVGALLAEEFEHQVADLVKMLSDTTQRLEELAYDEDSLAVRVTFDLAYQRLPDAQKRLFRLLALNPGPQVSMNAAAALTEQSLSKTRRLLARLRRAHMIDSGTQHGWFRFHDLLRLYATERTADEESDEVRRAATDRLLTHYCEVTGSAVAHFDRRIAAATSRSLFDTPQKALAWLDVERPTLVAAVALANVNGYFDHACQLAMYLRVYFDLRKHWDDWVTTHQVALEAAAALGDHDVEGMIRVNLGRAYQQVYRLADAVDCYKKALYIFEETGFAYGKGLALANEAFRKLIFGSAGTS